MKRKSQKLVLRRETLSALNATDLDHAAGGATNRYTCPSFTCYPANCDYSGRATCFTCVLTCTTNYC